MNITIPSCISNNFKVHLFQNIDIRVKGKHSHTPTKLDSNVAMTYAKGKDISATLNLRDKSAKLMKVNGGLTLQAPWAGLTLKSDLTQASKKQVSVLHVYGRTCCSINWLCA